MVSCCRVYVDTVIVDLKGWAKDFISTPIEDLWIRVRAETKARASLFAAITNQQLPSDVGNRGLGWNRFGTGRGGCW